MLLGFLNTNAEVIGPGCRPLLYRSC